ncbi:unnamed protein product, partial [Staurois parvus]
MWHLCALMGTARWHCGTGEATLIIRAECRLTALLSSWASRSHQLFPLIG